MANRKQQNDAAVQESKDRAAEAQKPSATKNPANKPAKKPVFELNPGAKAAAAARPHPRAVKDQAKRKQELVDAAQEARMPGQAQIDAITEEAKAKAKKRADTRARATAAREAAPQLSPEAQAALDSLKTLKPPVSKRTKYKVHESPIPLKKNY